MKKILFVAFSIILLVVDSRASWAGVDLPWSTSFVNCTSDWASPVGNDITNACEDSGNPLFHVYGTKYGSQGIYAAANNPNGGGGRGIRHWIGPGKNVGSGNWIVQFNTPQSEVWIRYYTRYQAGFAWNNVQYQKHVYFYPSYTVLSMNTDAWFIVPYNGNGLGNRLPSKNMYSISDGSPTCNTCGWNYLNSTGAMQGRGIRLGDDQWHAIEVHWKDQTGTGTYDGQFDLWVDGVLRWHVTGANWVAGAPTGTTWFELMTNQNVPSSSGVYQDVDDIAVSNTGYIGPIGGRASPDTTPPVMSNPLQRGSLNCTTDPLSVSLQVTTDENAICKYDTADVAYDSMANTYSTGNGTTSHSKTLSLACNASYTYYSRCMDGSGNKDTSSATHSFSIAAENKQ